MNLEPFQQCVVEESSELAEKLRALKRFTHTDVFRELSQYECGLLEQQAVAMDAYLTVLRLRVMAFHSTKEVHHAS